MPVAQGKLGLVVIVKDSLPVFRFCRFLLLREENHPFSLRRVALFTFFAISPPVMIVQPVAWPAFFRGFLPTLIWMAAVASDFLVYTLQGVFGLAVIITRFAPLGFLVTIGALFPQPPFVPILFFVAFNAGGWCVA